MTPVEAEKIINEYLKVIKDLRPDGIAQPVDDLPYPSGKIKQAYFVYGEELIRKNLLTRQVGDMLMRTYSQIDTKFTEDSEDINERYRKTMEGLERGEIIKNPIISGINENSVKAEIEYNNFLADCQRRHRVSENITKL